MIGRKKIVRLRLYNVRYLLFLVFCLFWGCSNNDIPLIDGTKQLSIKLMPLTEAYAKNSINTSVFRKNSICSDDNYQIVSYYDSEGFVTFAIRKLDSDNWEIIKSNLQSDCTDAHNSISIALDGEGYIHIAYDQHGNRMNYRKSLHPYQIVFSDIQYMVNPNDEQSVTYPEFYRKSNGNLIFVYRDGGSGNGDCVMNEYDLYTKQWSRIQNNLLDGQMQRNAYWQICMNNNDIIYMSWVWRESSDVATNHDMCYAYSIDNGLSWRNSLGNIYSLPINIENSEIAWAIPQNSNLINQTSMTTDFEGNPYIATYWSAIDSDVPQYHIIYNKDNIWRQTQISNRTLPFSLSGGGTKRIPIARPQFVIDKYGAAFFLFRDQERGEVVSIYYCEDINNPEWKVKDLTDFSVEAWEPTIDFDRWKREGILDVYVQKSYQGDGEVTIDNVSAEMAYVLEVTWK